jgi:hypothetical protein
MIYILYSCINLRLNAFFVTLENDNMSSNKRSIKAERVARYVDR